MNVKRLEIVLVLVIVATCVAFAWISNQARDVDQTVPCRKLVLPTGQTALFRCYLPDSRTVCLVVPNGQLMCGRYEVPETKPQPEPPAKPAPK